MADPRDAARRWLFQQIYDTEMVRGDIANVIADAIVNHPGVTVSALTGPAERWGPRGSLCIGPDLETRTAILLPAEEGTGT